MQPLRHSFNARLVDELPHLWAHQPVGGSVGRNVARDHTLHGSQYAQQAWALRVGGFFKPQASSRIAFAGQQHIGKAIGLADGVAAL